MKYRPDPRLRSDWYRGALKWYCGELEPSGGLAYLRDHRGQICGRTQSSNPEWFTRLAEEHECSVRDVWRACELANAGKALGERQALIVADMLDMASDCMTGIGTN